MFQKSIAMCRLLAAILLLTGKDWIGVLFISFQFLSSMGRYFMYGDIYSMVRVR